MSVHSGMQAEDPYPGCVYLKLLWRSGVRNVMRRDRFCKDLVEYSAQAEDVCGGTKHAAVHINGTLCICSLSLSCAELMAALMLITSEQAVWSCTGT